MTMKKVLSFLLALVLCLSLCACGECEHTYEEAITKSVSCTENGTKTFTCSKCNESYSEEIIAAGHKYKEANCNAPQTCEICGLTEGDPEHQYENKVCQSCGKHQPSEGLSYKLLDDGTYSVGIGECLDREIVISDIYNGEAVTQIRSRGFAESNIKSVFIPTSITKICDWAFTNCDMLVDVVFEEGSNLKIIDERAFDRCFKLERIVLPDGLEYLNDCVFASCSNELTYCELPSSLTWIGDTCFMSCYQLKTLSFRGTEAQWNAIDKHDDWHKFSELRTVEFVG